MFARAFLGHAPIPRPGGRREHPSAEPVQKKEKERAPGPGCLPG